MRPSLKFRISPTFSASGKLLASLLALLANFVVKNNELDDKLRLTSPSHSVRMMKTKIEVIAMLRGFHDLLDEHFGPRKALHSVECPVCGADEVYYLNEQTGKQIGRACEGCYFIQKFNF